MPTLLAEFHIPGEVAAFTKRLWADKTFYEVFLSNTLLDKDISIGEWVPQDDGSHVRDVKSLHPSKVSFPGLPSHAESYKTQRMEVSSGRSQRLTIVETNTFKGIPMCDYFTVCTIWNVCSASVQTDASSPLAPAPHCLVHISLEITFHKSTWLKGTIESNTKSELQEVCSLWRDSAEKWLSAEVDRAPICSPFTGVDIPATHAASGYSSPRVIGRSSSSNVEDEDDLAFYDCEEGAGLLLRPPEDLQPLLRDIQPHHRSAASSNSTNNSPHHHLASTCVEVVFVLLEAAFWWLHGVYSIDLKDMFSIEPSEVLRRCLYAFLPFKHASILSAPDIYGPLVATLSLPQVLLFAMDSTHFGCTRSALLGDAVMVAVSLWLGLAAMHRLLSFLVAPGLNAKHCVCLVGYSLFSWCIALLLSSALDAQRSLLHVPPQAPLILFGIPSALAQGCVFWEHIPIALQSHDLPVPLRRLADRNTQVAQRILRAIPKIVVCLVVACTHYQFMWYIARVFLPGRKHYCKLSALVNPANYADIITQKELRSFAQQLLKGKHHG